MVHRIDLPRGHGLPHIRPRTDERIGHITMARRSQSPHRSTLAWCLLDVRNPANVCWADVEHAQRWWTIAERRLTATSRRVGDARCR
jgi:hypothetical protein